MIIIEREITHHSGKETFKVLDDFRLLLGPGHLVLVDLGIAELLRDAFQFSLQILDFVLRRAHVGLQVRPELLLILQRSLRRSNVLLQLLHSLQRFVTHVTLLLVLVLDLGFLPAFIVQLVLVRLLLAIDGVEELQVPGRLLPSFLFQAVVFANLKLIFRFNKITRVGQIIIMILAEITRD